MCIYQNTLTKKLRSCTIKKHTVDIKYCPLLLNSNNSERMFKYSMHSKIWCWCWGWNSSNAELIKWQYWHHNLSVQDFRCRIFRMWNLWDVECSGCEIFGIWNVQDADVRNVESLGCSMFGIRDVGCLWCRMFEIWDVCDVGCLGCWMFWMFRMWDVRDEWCLGCVMFEVRDIPGVGCVMRYVCRDVVYSKLL